ncbi:MAG: LacI family DNA-binding transcriptional regulator [Eubacteriaceae bacterium]|nr:LacI family DNA-binding transcriptional regulator [Eubacteriaceae bacterium]
MTIKDVARLSGVSASTVSRVLNNHPDVSESVREKVLQIIDELHYVPNNSARDLVRSGEDTVGVVVRGAENPFFTGLIRSVEQEIEKAGYAMVLHQIKSGDDELAAGAELARSKRLCGLIFLGGSFDYTADRTAALGIPFICCSYSNSFGTLEKSSYSSVSINDEEEARRAVKYLTDRGHQKIAVLLDSVNDHSVSELRYRGYCRALEEAGIDPDPDLTEETHVYDLPAAYEGMKRLIGRGKDFTAVFATADSFGIAALKALNEAGKKVPEECSVIAIDGIEMSRYSIPTLTTLVQPVEEMGRKAVNILMDVIEGKDRTAHVYVKTDLREGGTVKAI